MIWRSQQCRGDGHSGKVLFFSSHRISALAIVYEMFSLLGSSNYEVRRLWRREREVMSGLTRHGRERGAGVGSAVAVDMW
ncbi:hypothetical protein ACFX12_029826 [Malus domestica]